MPVTISAKKALRRDQRRTKVNQRIREKIKKALSASRKKPTLRQITLTHRLLDRAAKKGVIHKNKASRLKSRLSKHLKPAKK